MFFVMWVGEPKDNEPEVFGSYNTLAAARKDVETQDWNAENPAFTIFKRRADGTMEVVDTGVRAPAPKVIWTSSR